jgi:hypothetical protein
MAHDFALVAFSVTAEQSLKMIKSQRRYDNSGRTPLKIEIEEE